MKEAGGRFRVLVLNLIVMALCGASGITYADDVNDGTVLPPTNLRVGERVLARAMQSLNIPGGSGRLVRISTAESGPGNGLLADTALEYLVGRGYRVAESDTLPEFRFSLDTLYVSIERPGWIRRNRAVRTAEARIGAEYHGPENTRQVFRGQGRIEDVFPASMIDHVEGNDLFPDRAEDSFGAARSVVFGLVVTGLIWLLYSYRG